MSREIKFRVYHKSLNEYIECGSLDFKLKQMINNNGVFNFDILILEQYTGLKDKNGVEIYEGDIINVQMYGGEYENYEIVFEDKDACFEAFNLKRDNYIISDSWVEYEVIGNTNENGGLLK